jgi:hypothetical protein
VEVSECSAASLEEPGEKLVGWGGARKVGGVEAKVKPLEGGVEGRKGGGEADDELDIELL